MLSQRLGGQICLLYGHYEHDDDQYNQYNHIYPPRFCNTKNKMKKLFRNWPSANQYNIEFLWHPSKYIFFQPILLLSMLLFLFHCWLIWFCCVCLQWTTFEIGDSKNRFKQPEKKQKLYDKMNQITVCVVRILLLILFLCCCCYY